MQSAKVVDS